MNFKVQNSIGHGNKDETFAVINVGCDSVSDPGTGDVSALDLRDAIEGQIDALELMVSRCRLLEDVRVDVARLVGIDREVEGDSSGMVHPLTDVTRSGLPEVDKGDVLELRGGRHFGRFERSNFSAKTE